MSKKITIAIDGNSGCGKSSTAKAVAAALGYTFMDTGAMYRAVTLYFLRNRIDINDLRDIQNALDKIQLRFAYNPQSSSSDIYLNEENVSEEIRKMNVANRVSMVSAISEVRRFLVARQQQMGKAKAIVAEGRDIGTVVFPDAELKVFMTAELAVRAQRRRQELQSRGEFVDTQDVMQNLRKRDAQDSGRKDSPLKKADDALTLDTTHLDFDAQVAQVLQWARAKIEEPLTE
ncbi:MAG: (d)CMP kinase [Bernardetiaceae bacterium]|nr:(d)CMP kinase [Bernardetiaceae bacterium]